MAAIFIFEIVSSVEVRNMCPDDFPTQGTKALVMLGDQNCDFIEIWYLDITNYIGL